MELLIKNLPLFIVFQIATTNDATPTQWLTLQRYPRNAQASISFGTSGNDKFVPGFTLPGNQYKQPPPLTESVPWYRFNNDIQQPQQFPHLSQDDVQYRSNNPVQIRPQEDQEYIQPLQVVDGYLQPATKNTKHDSTKVLDSIIKDRVNGLQSLQEDFNKLIEDIANTALSFVSKHGFFGGATRRSLFDPSNLGDLKTITADVSKVGADFYQIYNNILADIDGAVRFLFDHRNFSLQDLFAGGVTTMLRIFTFS